MEAISRSCLPEAAARTKRQRKATCCGVLGAASHRTTCSRSSAAKLTSGLILAMRTHISYWPQYVYLFMIHTTSLVEELHSMLESWRPGSLYVAYDVMKAGQTKIVATAMATALGYVNDPSKSHSEIQPACWVIRDFGTDAQFNQLLRAIRKYRYQDRKHYDELWRNTIWSDNDRERAVLC